MRSLKISALMLTVFVMLPITYAFGQPIPEWYQYLHITNQTNMPLYLSSAYLTTGTITPLSDVSVLGEGGSAVFQVQQYATFDYDAYVTYEFLTDQGIDGCVFSFYCKGSSYREGPCPSFTATGKRLGDANKTHWNANCTAYPPYRDGDNIFISVK